MTRILLIDDETGVRESVSRVLERAGFEVLAAENAELGLELLEENTIDVLVSDIIMPGMDGVKAIKTIRKSNPDMKIIAISGGGNFGPSAYQPTAITTTAYLQAATEAGADWVITKPFEKAELIDRIRELIG